MRNIVLILSSVLLNCSAQLLIRKGMLIIGDITGGIRRFLEIVPSLVTNIFLWLAMICYAFSILLWMVVLSKVEVSYAYPFLSIGYIVSAIVEYFAFGESLTFSRIIGIIIICIGVVLISRS